MNVIVKNVNINISDISTVPHGQTSKKIKKNKYKSMTGSSKKELRIEEESNISIEYAKK